MCLPMLAPDRKVLSGIQLDVQNIPACRFAKFKFLDAEPAMAFVRHVLKIGYAILHADHALVDRHMLRWNVVNLELGI